MRFQLLLISSDFKTIKTVCYKASSGVELCKKCLYSNVLYRNVLVEPELPTQRADVLKAIRLFGDLEKIYSGVINGLVTKFLQLSMGYVM